MNAPAIKPTITQRVRTFLASHGAPLAPWASLDETYAQLYALLRRRKDDPTFWDPLAKLLQEIIDSAVDPQRLKKLAAPQAELLASWDVDELVRNLRGALPPADPIEGANHVPDRVALGHFTRQLSAAMLGGFLLLGFVAAGTSSTSSSSSSSSGFDAGSEEDAGFVGPWDKNCTIDSASILYTTIEQSSLSDQAKNELCNCFENLNSSWTEGLSALFANGSPEEISDALSEMIECCTALHQLPDDYADGEAALLSGMLCMSNPIYKGVSFPS
ncbi:MAG: hypothetical protein JRI68_07660 [Deltaproteobacteria bacterium]|nr:hypothetical protein [Deltaproteobacteria bacterium]